MFRVAAGTEMTPEILAKYMAKHKTEINQRYQKLHDAYENKYKIDKMKKKPDWKPDNRIPVNFAKYITDTMNGFFIGIPIKTTADDETVSQYLEFLDQYNDQDDNNAELSKVCSIYGNGYVSTMEANLKTEISAKVGELQTTVEEEYAAKTEIVDLEGRLQTQITQNADNLSSTATKVEKLESDTEEAQKQVDQAITKADAAQSAAKTAQTQASAAQSAADAAQADATAAQTAATSAQQKADAAQALADTADKAVQAAQSDLNEAKQNLTNVTNRVGATEADIAAAQAKVDAAQEAVDNALEDAAEANLAASNAQQAADQAKLDAQEAQTAADNAQIKADNAQAVADKAQEDASQALKDVAALTQRVTTAETKIEQNSEQITLTASKVDEIGSRKVVTDTVPYFYLSTSSTQLVGGSWSTTPPAWREGAYYWQKVKTIYFDGTSSESTPICITGNTGADGTGVTILGSYDTEEELTEAHPTGSPGDSYMVSGDLYVWDSNTSKWKNVGRIKGEQGDPGPNGRSIASMTVEFYLSTSKTTQTGGSWTTTLPDWVNGKYLWTRAKIVYENPTSTEYTTPVCDASWEAANDVADDLHNNYYNKTETEAKIQVESEKITSSVTETITEEITKVEGNIENAQTAADDASAIASSTETRVTVAESTIEQLSNTISSLIVDENGTSMMTQTSDGWRFDMGSINSQLSDAKDQLNNLSGTVDGVEETIGNLNDLANDLSAKTAYITMSTDDAGDPCIELGKSDNDFKVRITNTSIDFMEGGSRIAYLSNSTLYIEKAVIKNQLQIGEGSGFVWKTRSNGHMGLRWEEGDS